MNAARVEALRVELERAHPEVRALDAKADDLDARLDEIIAERDGLLADVGRLKGEKLAADRAEAQARAQAVREDRPAPKGRTAAVRGKEDEAIAAARAKVDAIRPRVDDHQRALDDQEAELQALKDRLRPELTAAAEAQWRQLVDDGHGRLAAAVAEVVAARGALVAEYGRPPLGLHYVRDLPTRSGDRQSWDTVLAALIDAANPAAFVERPADPPPEIDWENHDVAIAARHMAAGGSVQDPFGVIREKHGRPTLPTQAIAPGVRAA